MGGEVHVEQRIWLRMRERSGLCARALPKACTNATLVRTTACHAEADGRRTYAGYATGKGHITRAWTRWPVIRQQFSALPAKKPNGQEGSGCSKARCFPLLPSAP
jgi:hypothetical protein